MKPLTRLITGVLGATLWLTACDQDERPIADPSGKPTQPAPEEHTLLFTEKLEPYECGSVKRLHTYNGILLGSQPAPEDFEQLKKDGIKTVVNLRHTDENKDLDEKQTVTDLGLGYHNPAWNGPEELTDEKFDRVRELLKTAEQPILLHCGSGNRVGAHWLTYRVLEDGLAYDEAVEEAKVVGLQSSDYEAKAKAYIDQQSEKEPS